MASAINSDNGVVSGSAGLKSSADSSGVLDLQTNGTTAISISASQVVTYTNQPTYTGGTANGVMYLNGSKAVTTGSALVFDGTNLGVGVSSPAYRLDLSIGATSGAKLFKFTGASSQSMFGYADSGGVGITRTDPYNTMVYLTTGNTIEFYTASALRAYFDSTGALFINRASNGVHLQTQVNSVNTTALGSFNGAPTVGSNLSGYSGIMFNGASLEPTLDGLNTRQSALVDIGSTGFRFKTGHFTGINFPATQVASADANTLDDYEEGTWTPSLAGVANLNAISTVSARYTKVGNVVMCQGTFTATTAGAGTVAFTMTGPFNMVAVQNVGQLGVVNCYPYAGTFKQSGYIIDNSGGEASSMYVEFYINSGTSVNLNFQLTYQTS